MRGDKTVLHYDSFYVTMVHFILVKAKQLLKYVVVVLSQQGSGTHLQGALRQREWRAIVSTLAGLSVLDFPVVAAERDLRIRHQKILSVLNHTGSDADALKPVHNIFCHLTGGPRTDLSLIHI